MDYEDKYKSALERAKIELNADTTQGTKNVLMTVFPELKESEDEKIRKGIIELVKQSSEILNKQNQNNMIAWLEKQGNNNSQNWKPSKEEMDVLYGLAYITNQYDEHKEEVVTRLYQDLKREFFNGSSYENMFPNTEDDVRRRSTIQVLEYARSLDTYNQYGKADIDKNIAWLEKQKVTDKEIVFRPLAGTDIIAAAKQALEKIEIGKEVILAFNGAYIPVNGKTVAEICNEYFSWVEKQGKKQFADKLESKFKVGDWVVNNNSGDVFQVTEIKDDEYCLWPLYGEICGHLRIIDVDTDYHPWTIADAKDGDVLSNGKMIVIFKHFEEPSYLQRIVAYIGLDNNGDIQITDDTWTLGIDKANPATKEQREILMKEMTDEGYQWDAEKKELKKISNVLEECEIAHIEHGKYYYCIKDYYAGGNKRASKGDVVQALNGMSMMALGVKANEYFIPVNNIKQKSSWSVEDSSKVQRICKYLDEAKKYYADITEVRECMDWLKSLEDRVQPKPTEWSEEDEKIVLGIEQVYNCASLLNIAPDKIDDVKKWLKSLKERLS